MAITRKTTKTKKPAPKKPATKKATKAQKVKKATKAYTDTQVNDILSHLADYGDMLDRMTDVFRAAIHGILASVSGGKVYVSEDRPDIDFNPAEKLRIRLTAHDTRNSRDTKLNVVVPVDKALTPTVNARGNAYPLTAAGFRTLLADI